MDIDIEMIIVIGTWGKMKALPTRKSKSFLAIFDYERILCSTKRPWESERKKGENFSDKNLFFSLREKEEEEKGRKIFCSKKEGHKKEQQQYCNEPELIYINLSEADEKERWENWK